MVGADSSKFTQAGFHDVFIVVLGLLVLIFHTFKLQFVPKSTNRVLLTSGVDIHPISWLSVSGIEYFLVGTSWALRKALMKSSGGQKNQIIKPTCLKTNLYKRNRWIEYFSHLIPMEILPSSGISSVVLLHMGLSGSTCTVTQHTHTHIRKGGIQYNNYTELYKRGPNCHEMHSTRAFQCLALPNKHAGH